MNVDYYITDFVSRFIFNIPVPAAYWKRFNGKSSWLVISTNGYSVIYDN